MLKLSIGLLLLVNLGLYGYNAGFLGSGTIEGREPARAASQVNPERIRRVEPAAAAPASALPAAASRTAEPEPAMTAVALAAAESASTAPLMPALAATPVAAAASCVEVGNFDAADARRFEAQLAPLGLGTRLARRNVQEVERYIVYIPPLPDKESADRKAAELRRFGIDDFYIIQDNSDLRWGISLGMFKTADAASLHLANLAQKGVRSARVAARPGPTSKTAFQLRGLDTAAQATLSRIRLGFARQETRTCPPA